MRVLITGANGHLGTKLIGRLQENGAEIVALVRSERAAATVRGSFPEADIRIVDYRDAEGIRVAGQGCQAIVHLVGIIKESAENTYEMAHEQACEAIIQAGLDAERLVCLGIVGTEAGSTNACFRSRSNAEQILLGGSVPATIIRVPMVLGPDDYATWSLKKKAQAAVSVNFRADSLEQPIFSEDVIAAIIAALGLSPDARVLTLAGTESLSRSALIKRAGTYFDNQPKVISLPMWLGMLMAGLLEALMSNPPVSRAMLGVLDHDDDVDVSEAVGVLGIKLTDLNTTLGNLLSNKS
jgi:NADH dehydrogenase